MVLRRKPEANRWLHLTPRIAALGIDVFVKESNLAGNAEEKSAVFVNRMCQLTLEAFWSEYKRRGRLR